MKILKFLSPLILLMIFGSCTKNSLIVGTWQLLPYDEVNTADTYFRHYDNVIITFAQDGTYTLVGMRNNKNEKLSGEWTVNNKETELKLFNIKNENNKQKEVAILGARMGGNSNNNITKQDEKEKIEDMVYEISVLTKETLKLLNKSAYKANDTDFSTWKRL